MAKIIIKSIMDKNGVIGINGKLPWHIPEDLKDFKASTLNKPMIMGRKTFESLPRYLPNRKHIVVTRDLNYRIPSPHAVVHNLNDAFALVMDEPEAYVIGGGEIYEQSLPFADHIELTIVQGEYEGDAHFPPLKISEWKMMSTESQIVESGIKIIKLMFNKI